MNTVFRLALAIGLCCLVSGCGTSVISSNSRQVIVESPMRNSLEAQRLADLECLKNQRYAKMVIKADSSERNYTFECVE